MRPIFRPPHGVSHSLTQRRHHLAAALCGLLLLAAYGHTPKLAAPALAPVATQPATLPASHYRLTLPGSSARVRSPSLAALPDGRLAAVWLGEGHGQHQADQAIWFSTLQQQNWHEPYALVTRETAAGHTLAHLSGIARPLLLAHADRLDLWFNAHGPGQQMHPAIHVMTSYDAGHSWSTPRRLAVSSWLQGGHLEGARPAQALADGGSLLALAERPDAARFFWLRLNAAGQVIARSDADGSLTVERMLAARPLPTQGPHALLPLGSDQLLLAGSSDPQRSELCLWLAAAQDTPDTQGTQGTQDTRGSAWQSVRRVASTPPTPDVPQPLADPVLQMTGDGRIHLLYVWRGHALHHLAFTPAWLARAGEAP